MEYSVWRITGVQKRVISLYALYAKPHTRNRGFSLIEMMVAVALFAVVMLVSTTALLSLIDANRKAQAVQSVMNNLNISLDGLVRNARMGSHFSCGSFGTAPSASSMLATNNCSQGNTFAFTPFGKNASDSTQKWVYYYDASNPNRKVLKKSEDGGQHYYLLTAPEVQLDDLQFYVTGSTAGDNIPPRLVMLIKGTAGGDKQKTKTTFNIQATAVQRILDL